MENGENGRKGGVFQTVFTRGRVEIGAPLHPTEFSEKRTVLRFSKLKKLLLIVIICALCLTVLLIIKQMAIEDRPESETSAVLSADTGLNLTANQLIVKNASNEVLLESMVGQTSTTSPTPTTTPLSTTTIESQSMRWSTTTEGSTTTEHRIIDHILASIVINKATVPNKDGYVSLTDTYVKAYVDDNFIGQTPVRKESLSPVWDYQMAHRMTLKPDSVLRFKLYDNDKYSSHEFLGEFEVTTSELIADGANGTQVRRDHGSGHLWFTVTWDVVYSNN